jgi:DNA-binding IclR family transcriptional regulator
MSSTVFASRKPPIGTLSRGLYLLECVADLGGGVRLGELAVRAGLDKGTTHRLTRKLEQLGYLNRDAAGRMSVGLRLLSLAFNHVVSIDVRTHALPEMRELLAELDCSVSLGTLDGTELVYLERLQSKRLQPTLPVGVGARVAAYCTAGGKAMLAQLRLDELEAVIAKIEFRSYTRRTLGNRNALLADLRLTAERGFALNDQEQVEGYRAAAAPIFDHTGKCVACVSVGAFDSQKSASAFRQTIGPRLAEAARRISARLGKREPLLSTM